LGGLMPLVQRPLAAILARGDRGITSPRELEGRTVGVTGLPSDEAVVDSEVSADGGDPATEPAAPKRRTTRKKAETA